jgi:hypothetical protein
MQVENTFLTDAKQIIIKRFIQNVKGKQFQSQNSKHDGSEGHWLETQMGISHNCKNEPDIFGYEMKKNSVKITFGDFSASEYLFSKKKKFIGLHMNNGNVMSRSEFITYFGQSNPLKNNRYSWAGSCVPTYGNWNKCGQMLVFNDNMDLCAKYSFEKDTRECKHTFPLFLQTEPEITIAILKKEKLEEHINKKFNKNGFFICKKVNEPFDFNHFADNIKNKNIIFDSGMFVGNTRNYSHFRSTSRHFWNNLIIEVY